MEKPNILNAKRNLDLSEKSSTSCKVNFFEKRLIFWAFHNKADRQDREETGTKALSYKINSSKLESLVTSSFALSKIISTQSTRNGLHVPSRFRVFPFFPGASEYWFPRVYKLREKNRLVEYAEENNWITTRLGEIPEVWPATPGAFERQHGMRQETPLSPSQEGALMVKLLRLLSISWVEQGCLSKQSKLL